MSLTPGVRFGSYEVIAPLGRGAMGEVYRARDSRLRRDVALKVLPDLHRFDPERRARFEREALALASVNHPNIATIHGVEDSAGIQAIVMELVDGETLADRLISTRLSFSDVRAFASQIADALEAAHERGIIHRDLKPSNVKVRTDGTLKVLDFGLAKALEAERVGIDPRAITVSVADAVLGTPCYMSPEQARGQSLDRRTDIWAFGCVLYEMLTGRRAFDGPTTSDVIAGVLDREPDYEALPASTPPLVRRLLRRCLEKDVRRRLRDIADARVDLEDAGGDLEASSSSKSGRRWAVVAGVTAGAVLGIVALASWIDRWDA